MNLLVGLVCGVLGYFVAGLVFSTVIAAVIGVVIGLAVAGLIPHGNRL